MLRPHEVSQLQITLPEYELIHAYAAAIPVYECHVEARLLARHSLAAIEEAVLKCVNEGLDSPEAIDLVLGAGLAVITDALASLLADDLVTPRVEETPGIKGFVLTEQGVDAMISASTRSLETHTLRVIYDGLLGRLAPAIRYLDIHPAEVERRGLHPVPPRMDPPVLGDIDRNSLAAVLRETRQMNKGRIPEGELHDIIRLSQTFLMYRPCDVVAFEARDRSHVTFRVFDRKRRLADYETMLGAMLEKKPEVLPIERIPPKDQEGRDVFNLPPEIVATVKAREAEIAQLQGQLESAEDVSIPPGPSTVEPVVPDSPAQPTKVTTREQLEALRVRLAELEREKKKLPVRVLEVEEHRPLLEKAFKYSRERVLIVSPWLNADSIDGALLNLMRRALRRGIEIVLAWGMPPEGTQRATMKESRSRSTLRKLENLAAEQNKGTLRIVHLGNTHEKVLIADKRYAVVGSFNWLSFRGDPSRGIRREMSFCVEDEEFVEVFTERFMGLIEAAEMERKKAKPSADDA